MVTSSTCFRFLILSCVAIVAVDTSVSRAADNDPPPGYRALFNGKDLSGWHGVGTEDPRKIAIIGTLNVNTLK